MGRVQDSINTGHMRPSKVVASLGSRVTEMSGPPRLMLGTVRDVWQVPEPRPF